jgi:O-antigen/teichoic acid export membrane protein
VHIIAAKDIGTAEFGALGEVLNKFLRPPLEKGTYGLFYTLLVVLSYIGIPAAGLQTIIAQQTAMATSEAERGQLRRTIHVIILATFFIWMVAVVVVFLARQPLLTRLKIADQSALWVTLLAGLLGLWLPIMMGVLQGRQNFLWLGWTSILSGLGRCAAIFIIVRLLGGGITGAMSAVLLGTLVALIVSAWQARSIWQAPAEAFAWKPWLGRAIPLTAGVGATIFIMTADAILVRNVFNEVQTGFYSAAGILGRALAYFTGPMTAVMFPKIVQSAARAERTSALAQALGATALLGGLGALFCTFFPEVPLRIMYDQTYLFIKPLVPWFAWCVLPLTLANVLISNLLARGRYAVVPWLVALAGGYWVTLWVVGNRIDPKAALAAFKTIVSILGLFGLLALAVCCWFTWRTTEHGQSRPAKAGAVA